MFIDEHRDQFGVEPPRSGRGQAICRHLGRFRLRRVRDQRFRQANRRLAGV